MGGPLKFLQFAALQKHLHSSASLNQLPRSYLIIHSQREERRRVLENLKDEILNYYKDATSIFFDAEQISWGQVHESLMTPSLFGEEEIVIWNGLKSLPEQVIEKSIEYILAPSSRAFFIMGAESSKGFADLYQKAKKELVLLDFSEEKPWDKQKRVHQEMMLLIKKEGKIISSDAFSRLVFLCGSDPLPLESEINKIIAYVGDRKEITEKDVSAIASPSSVATGWQLSEGLVWGDTLSMPHASLDLSFLLAFIGQVRFYLQQGRQVGWCLQQKMTPDEISKVLPQIKSSQLQKISASLRLRKMVYFDEALQILSEVELLSKNSNLSSVFLFDLLQTKLTHLKKINIR